MFQAGKEILDIWLELWLDVNENVEDEDGDKDDDGYVPALLGGIQDALDGFGCVCNFGLDVDDWVNQVQDTALNLSASWLYP